MKKILYFIMFILGIVGIIALWFTPFYHFNKDKALLNNPVYIYLVDVAIKEDSTLFIEETDIHTYELANEQGFLLSSKEEQAMFKDQYLRQMKSFMALMNENEDEYYIYNMYEVLNNVKNSIQFEFEMLSVDTQDIEKAEMLLSSYKELSEKEDLTFNSSEEEVNNLDKLLKPYITILKLVSPNTLSYEQRIENEKATLLNTRRQAIINYLSNDGDIETAKNVCLEVTTGDIVGTLFLGLQEEYYGSDFYVSKINKYKEKGIGFTLLLTTWEKAIDIYKAYFNDPNNESKTKVEKIKEAFLVKYNIFPLLIISIVLLIFALCNIKLIFGGLKGIRGKKYPHTFITCLIGLAITIVLVFSNSIIDNSFFISYSYAPEMLKLKQMFLVGNFDAATIYCLCIFAACLFISVIGRFFSWKKKKRNK